MEVEGGAGGDGAVAFRREKFVPFGGPSGGDGGRGGSVLLQADAGLSTLFDLRHRQRVAASAGAAGQGRDRNGRSAEDVVLRVPPGTIVFDAETKAKLGEVVADGDDLVVARGGDGGRGNKHFATSTDRAPQRAESGQPGQRRRLRLELRVLADVGLLGFPNVGKSTFISAVSRARPKVADYPFTTLEPQLGVVAIGDVRGGLGKTFVVADIPGLVEGASEGAGLGARFLRHLERTRVLLHLVTATLEPGRSPLADYDAVRAELRRFNPDLGLRPEIVAMTKADLPEVREAYPDAKAAFEERGIELRLVSSATGEGVEALLWELAATLQL